MYLRLRKLDLGFDQRPLLRAIQLVELLPHKAPSATLQLVARAASTRFLRGGGRLKYAYLYTGLKTRPALRVAWLALGRVGPGWAPVCIAVSFVRSLPLLLFGLVCSYAWLVVVGFGLFWFVCALSFSLVRSLLALPAPPSPGPPPSDFVYPCLRPDETQQPRDAQ